MQLETNDGREAHYIVRAHSYLRYYAAALQSAIERAPSLMPVLVTHNTLPKDFVDWATSHVSQHHKCDEA